MNEEEKALAEKFYAAIQDASNYSNRSMQSRSFQVGISDLGFCSERTRRMLNQDVPEDTDMLLAWIGTALGDHAEEAAVRAWPTAMKQTTVAVTLVGDSNEYRITGHPDLIIPDDAILVDVKTDYGLTSIARTGPSQQQQFQRHCYALGAHEAGLFGDTPLEEVRVANVWIDRSGIEKGLHVQMEPFNQEYVDGAAAWLDEVVYSYIHQQEAQKEPPREMCAVVCGFYQTCRAFDTDVEGLLTDQVVLTNVEMYQEGLDLEKQGKKLKDEAKAHLRGVTGSTGQFMLRWVHVNETVVPETVRRSYDKLDLRPIPKRKN